MSKPRVLREFRDFIGEFNIISLTIAFVTGIAANSLIQSFVNNILMPLLDPLIPDGTWQTATLTFWSINLKWGIFVSSLLHFILIMIVIFIIVKKILRFKPKYSKNA